MRRLFVCSSRRLVQAAHCACVLLCVGLAGTAKAQQDGGDGLRISADATRITLDLPDEIDTPIRVYALAAKDQPNDDGTLVYSGAPVGQIHLQRDSNRGDLLFRRFVVKDQHGNLLVGPAWVSDASALPAMGHPMPWPEQIKGVSNPEDIDDLVALGVKHVHVNIILGGLLLPDNAPDPDAAYIRTIHGQRVRLNPRAIAQLDAEFSRMTREGINVVAVLLNRVPREANHSDLLVHPQTDIQGAPHALAAFNLDSDRAVAAYVGAIGFLAERYSRADKRYGWIGGYIIGNEVDSHWVWHNMGPASVDQVANHYIQEVQLAWLAVREHHGSPKVFVSLTHSWTRPNAIDPLRSAAGKELLDRLTQLSREGGDFGWDVAYHPYPQNLFEPRFWDDRMAMFGYDTPMITFKNIEVLPAYLDRPEMHYQGKPRRVILSEQGLHTPPGPDGEKIQAAALALALYRVKVIDGIDAFILHRHVDSRQEGGLLLGLRGPAEANNKLGDKKQSWDVFQAFETPQWQEVAGFALEVAGYDNWTQARPAPGPFPDVSPEWAVVQRHEKVIVDLLEQLDEATISNALAAQQKIVNLHDGGFVDAFMLHPKPPTEPNATAVYVIQLPADTEPTLKFQTYLDKRGGDGVVFRVRVNGDIVFQLTVDDPSMLNHSVDLKNYAGQEIELTLEVGPRRNSSYDAAYWLGPAIVDSSGDKSD